MCVCVCGVFECECVYVCNLLGPDSISTQGVEKTHPARQSTRSDRKPRSSLGHVALWVHPGSSLPASRDRAGFSHSITTGRLGNKYAPPTDVQSRENRDKGEWPGTQKNAQAEDKRISACCLQSPQRPPLAHSLLRGPISQAAALRCTVEQGRGSTPPLVKRKALEILG